MNWFWLGMLLGLVCGWFLCEVKNIGQLSDLRMALNRLQDVREQERAEYVRLLMEKHPTKEKEWTQTECIGSAPRL